jgi:hypothetical protein
VELEAARSSKLLKKMLPDSIIQRLTLGQSPIADRHKDVSVVSLPVSKRNPPRIVTLTIKTYLPYMLIDKVEDLLVLPY